MSIANLGFQLIPPSPPLRPYVRSYWVFERESPLLTPQAEFMHPRGGFGLAFNFGDALSLDAQPITEAVFLDGATTISRQMGFTGRVALLGVSFRVGGAYPFFGMPLAELTNETAALDALHHADLLQLSERMAEADSMTRRIAILETWLIKRLARGMECDPLIPASLDALRTSGGSLAIRTLAESFAISQRHLERLYQRQVGMSPKKYAQLLRVETARLALKDMHLPTTTDLAVELGFYDQSHFIREFQAVIGMTPYRYLRRSQAR